MICENAIKLLEHELKVNKETVIKCSPHYCIMCDEYVNPHIKKLKKELKYLKGMGE